MAQSQSDLKLRKKSTANQMELSKQELLEIDPEEVLDWDVDKLEAGLKELDITIGVSWSKSKKACELNKALEKIKNDDQDKQMPMDPNVYMLQALQQLQQQTQYMEARMQAQAEAQAQMQAQAEAQAEAMAAIAEKVSGNAETTNNSGGNKSRAKGRHPEKLERDVDYATLLQWEKSWKLFTISDNLDTLTDKQQTAILFSFFTKELLSDMEYRFKINIEAEQTVEEVLEAMKTYLKG